MAIEDDFLSHNTELSTYSQGRLPSHSRRRRNSGDKGRQGGMTALGFPLLELYTSRLADTLYNVYCTAYPKSKKLWEALDKKYKLEDAGTKKFPVGMFLDYKMVDTKLVVNQLEEPQVLFKDLLSEGLVINEPFQVVAVIKKLPPSWKDFKNYLKHKGKSCPWRIWLSNSVSKRTIGREIKSLLGWKLGLTWLKVQSLNPRNNKARRRTRIWVLRIRPSPSVSRGAAKCVARRVIELLTVVTGRDRALAITNTRIVKPT